MDAPCACLPNNAGPRHRKGAATPCGEMDSSAPGRPSGLPPAVISPFGPRRGFVGAPPVARLCPHRTAATVSHKNAAANPYDSSNHLIHRAGSSMSAPGPERSQRHIPPSLERLHINANGSRSNNLALSHFRTENRSPPPAFALRHAHISVVPAHSASKTRVNALREPGPIHRSLSRGHGVWVPASAGTTAWRCVRTPRKVSASGNSSCLPLQGADASEALISERKPRTVGLCRPRPFFAVGSTAAFMMSWMISAIRLLLRSAFMAAMAS